jgi:hypothetical protein
MARKNAVSLAWWMHMDDAAKARHQNEQHHRERMRQAVVWNCINSGVALAALLLAVIK